MQREPSSRQQIIEQTRQACENGLIDADVLSVFEGAIKMSDLHAGDIMVTRSQMSVIQSGDPIETIAASAARTGHSRFPAIGKNKDDILGIFLAKDLLRHYAGEDFDFNRMLRPAVFVTESKPLNMLLREFRLNRNHMAIVVDEYGSTAGLITIEDVLEQIVGNIEDEHDQDDGSNIRLYQEGRYRVRAATEIEDFNTAFGTTLNDDENDTIGGHIIRQLGRLPSAGERLQVEDLPVRIVRADKRRIHSLLVECRERPQPAAASPVNEQPPKAT